MQAFDPSTYPLPKPARWYWRLPVVRHIRALVVGQRVERHYRAWERLGRLSVYREYDDRIVREIWKGTL